MNLTRLFLIAILLLAYGVVANGQEPSVPVLFDEFRSYNCEDLLARLDNFALELQNRKTNGVVVFYKSPDPINNIFTYRFLNGHKVTRKLFHTYMVVPVNDQSKSGIEFWIGGGPKQLKTSIPTFDLGLANGSNPVYFSGDLFERVKIEGKWTFTSWDCAACCINWLHLGLLQEFLAENKGAKAYFVLRGNKARADLLKTYLLKEATDSKFPHSKMRFIYAGRKMINDHGKFIEVEAFISKIETKSPKIFPYKLAADSN